MHHLKKAFSKSSKKRDGAQTSSSYLSHAHAGGSYLINQLAAPLNPSSSASPTGYARQVEDYYEPSRSNSKELPQAVPYISTHGPSFRSPDFYHPWTTSPITLFCLVYGDPNAEPFPVKIDREETVGVLTTHHLSQSDRRG